MGLMLGPRSPMGTSPAGPDSAAAGTPVILPEGWTVKVADRIINTVDAIRDKTTVPIQKAGRAVVWGLLIATAAVSLGIVLLLGMLRLLYEAVGRLPGIDGRAGRSVWIVDLLTGSALLGAGLLLMRKGSNRPE